jgi:hypothetical protein
MIAGSTIRSAPKEIRWFFAADMANKWWCKGNREDLELNRYRKDVEHAMILSVKQKEKGSSIFVFFVCVAGVEGEQKPIVIGGSRPVAEKT